MRTTNWILLSVATVATGCGYQATTGGGKRGATMKQHAGAISVVFTNASPEKMCGFHMSFDGEAKHGDNWLPVEGLPSGKSVEFKVKPGKYKATWNTCTSSDKPYYAATLTNDWAFEVKDSTQLFAYVADTVAPTKRAAPKDFYAMVKFPGQQINPGQPAKQDPLAKPAAEEATPEATPVVQHRDPNEKVQAKVEGEGSFDAKDWVEKKPKGKKGDKKAAKLKPTLDRSVDVANAKVKFAAAK